MKDFFKKLIAFFTTASENPKVQAVKFTVFSMSAGIIQVVSYAIMHDLIGIEAHSPCYLVSLILSVLWNFTFNRKYTFRSDVPLAYQMVLVALFYVVFTPLSNWWGVELEKLGVHDWLIQLGTMLVNFITEFLYQKFVVFRKAPKKDEQVKA